MANIVGRNYLFNNMILLVIKISMIGDPDTPTLAHRNLPLTL